MGILHRAAQGGLLPTFSPQGRREYLAKIENFGTQLEAECDRISSAENSGKNQEITREHVARADVYLRFLPPTKKPGALFYVAVGASPIAAVLGAFAGEHYEHLWGSLGMAGAVTVIIGAEAYKLKKGSS